MWKFWTLCLLTAAYHCALASDLKCGDIINSKDITEGSFSGPPSDFEAKKACNLTIILPKGNSSITAQLSMVSIAEGDSLMVYDGPQNLLANFASRSVARQVLVGFQQKMVFMFTSSKALSKSSWEVEFNTEECAVSLQNGWITNLDSPTYVKTKEAKELECTYTVISFLPPDFIAAAAFTGFTLTGSSSLGVEGAQESLSYTSDSPLDDFFGLADTALVLTLKIADTTTVQKFALTLEPVLKKCSGSVSVNGSQDVSVALTPLPGQPSSCRWLISSGQRPLLLADVSSLLLAASGGGDSVTFRSGGSSSGAVLETLVNDVNDHLVVTSQNKLLVTLTKGVMEGEFQLNVTFMDAEFGGRLEGEGYISAGETTGNENIFFSLVAAPGQWVDVSSMSKLTNGSSVYFYDGPQQSSPLLAVWSENDQELSPVTGHDQMLVVVSDLAAGELFNASFTSVPSGCDSLTSSGSGTKTFSAGSTLLKDETCTWTVAPINVTGTLLISLSSVNLRDKESLTLTSGLDSSGQVLAQFTGPHAFGGAPLPQVYVAASEKFRVTFTRIAAASQSSGAIVQYRTLPQSCGGLITSPKGMIQTPNYPNQYPLNADCIWTISSSELMTPMTSAPQAPLLLLSFASLALAQEHSISVLLHQENKSQPLTVATYGGVIQSASDLPNDLILPGAPDLSVAFSSQPSSAKPMPGSLNNVAGGASLNYWVLECGGNFSAANGSFTSPEFSKPPTKSALCVWILNVAAVKGPENSTNIVSFNINVVGKDANSVGKYLKIYDGPSMRSPYYPLSSSASNLSRYDSIVVMFDLEFDESTKPDIRLNFTYKTIICNTSQLCANRVCLHPDWICNGHDDCGDNTDEQNCVIPPPSPKPVPAQSFSGWVKSGWVPGCLFIGLFLGAGLVFFGPRVYRRLRSRGGGNYNRMEEPVV